MLFDDPLSALDANVSNFLMENTMCRELKEKTRIIVTHAVQFLKYADCILYVERGEIKFSGTYDSLKKTEYLRNLSSMASSDASGTDISASDGEGVDLIPKKKKKKEKKVPVKKEADEVRVLAKADQLDPILSRFATEERTKGSLSCGVVHTYITNTGGYLLFIFLFVVTVIGAIGQAYGARFLLNWGGNGLQPDTKWINFATYCSILYGYCIIAVFRFAILLALGVNYSRRAHSQMVFKVLHAQVEEFIEKVSLGRLINRFTKDLDVLDKSIMKSTGMFIYNLILVLVNCALMVWSVDYVIIAPLFINLIFSFWLQRNSMGVKREAVRLEAISKSPILSWTKETIKGLPQVRSMSKINYVSQIMIDMLHKNMVNSVLAVGLDAYFRMRVALSNILIVQIPSYFYLTLVVPETQVGSVAFFLLISTILSDDILRSLTFFSEVEANLISVERVAFFTGVPTEKNYKTFEAEFQKYLYIPEDINLRSLTTNPSDKIVKQGEVKFQNVTARYGEDAEPVLKNLDFTVRPGEKIGIVGRTGAGKSSLIKLFWMSLAPSEGKVLVDGHDITQQDLKTLRNEVMVVSQDTALFQGTLGENIDPNMTEKDYPNAMEILTELGLGGEKITTKGMESKVDTDGNNFSQGEKQLICFARTLINKKKIIILDEATSNIDMETELAIKRIQETKFADSTMFIIAHRLKTVMHCDRIMVLKFGRIVEFDSPKNLLEIPDGLFKDMYDKMAEQDEEN
jgi:ATP-binding cassette, subfamily C (CFTR/MRP), member 1